jgi:molybdenum cofactor biosynthesis enzyme MoaA
MVRKEFVDIVQRLAKLPVELTLTTNGVLVHKHIELFKEAGIRSVNVSLDTLNPEVFIKSPKETSFSRYGTTSCSY